MKIVRSSRLGQAGINHGFSTRVDGFSFKNSPITDTSTEDSALALEQLLKDQPGIKPMALLYLEGGDNVVKLEQPIDGSITILGCDGIATSLPISLGLTVADCLPILLIDPASKVIGVAHGGWKGLAGQIVTKTVKAMVELGATTSSILVGIGPSICVKCYEVGDEVAQQFDEAVVNRKHQKPHIDLWQAALIQLESAGVTHTQNLKICTYEHNRDYYSARFSQPTGRFIGYISNL